MAVVELGNEGIQLVGERYLPAGTVRCAATVGQVTVGTAFIRCKRLMEGGVGKKKKEIDGG